MKNTLITKILFSKPQDQNTKRAKQKKYKNTNKFIYQISLRVLKILKGDWSSS